MILFPDDRHGDFAEYPGGECSDVGDHGGRGLGVSPIVDGRPLHSMIPATDLD